MGKERSRSLVLLSGVGLRPILFALAREKRGQEAALPSQLWLNT
jgi:hypothetical protein